VKCREVNERLGEKIEQAKAVEIVSSFTPNAEVETRSTLCLREVAPQ